MNRRVATGVGILAVGIALLIAAERFAPPSLEAPAVESDVAKEDAAVAVAAPAAPLTLMPAEAHAEPALVHGALSGRVLSWGNGHGVARAEVTFAHQGVTHALETAAEGDFELVAPEPGRYELAVVSAEGFLPFAPTWGHSPVVFHTRPGQRITGITVYLTPALAYAGVVETPAGERVAGAVVRVVGEDAGMSLAPELEPVETDARGEFAMAAPDYALLEANHPDWAPGRARVDFSVQVSHRVRIRLGERARTAERLAIAGRVLAGNAPVPSAVVEARFAAANPAVPSAQLRTSGRAVTGASGGFAVTDLDAGSYTLTAVAPGFAPALRRGVRAGSRDVELRLAPGLALRGTVTDASSGAPVPSFALMLSPAGGRQRVESVLDAAGAYEIHDLGPASYRVRVAAYGYAISAASKVTLVAPQHALAVLDFALTAGGRVHGTVIDEATRSPLAGARVSCETGSAPGRESAALPIAASALTDAGGHFELRGVASGLRSLVVAAAGHHGRIISGLEVEDDGDIGPLTIELAPVAEGDQPRLELTGIGAVLSRSEDGLVIGETLEAGGAALAGLVAGDIILAIDGAPVGEVEFGDAIEMIRGVEGSNLTLSVRKADSGEEAEMVIVRRRVRR